VRSAWSARSYEGIRAPGEAESCSQQLAALVEHGLFDDLVGSQ
jgi:hypothetical protein